MALIPILSNESSIHVISAFCSESLPTAAGVGQSILATVAIHAPRKVISALAESVAKSSNMTMLRNFPILYMKYLGIRAGLDDVGEVLAVGVGNKNLTELFAAHHRHDALNAFAVEPVKDIVQQ